MHQQQGNKKAKALFNTVNQETIKQPYMPSGSMEAIIYVSIEPGATKLKLCKYS